MSIDLALGGIQEVRGLRDLQLEFRSNRRNGQ